MTGTVHNVRLVVASSVFLLQGFGVQPIHAQVTVAQEELLRNPAVASPADLPQGTRTDANASLQRRISIRLERVPLVDALDSISKRANIVLSYKREYLPVDRVVTLNRTNERVIVVLDEALKGTQVAIKVSDGGRIHLVPPQQGEVKDTGTQDAGGVSGRVTDSATQQGVRDVTVTVQGSRGTVLTDAMGNFIIRNVPIGEHVVVIKALGYASVNRRIQVEKGKVTTVNVVLRNAPTALAGVVTTATGPQRRLEVGNDIPTIRVDSVLKAMPVTTLTDLLATRIPGLYAAPASGEPGAATRIRIRGVSSINASNDPLVIIDGVQVYAQQVTPPQTNTGLGKNGFAKTSNTFALSPLDQIDPNSIETVEVLKGPSAVALYGSDAANGVIVITTRRGQVGPPQWGASANWASEYMPGKWPSNYYAWGHPTQDETSIANCKQMNRGVACQFDSMSVYQILNDRSTTIFGRGTRQTYRADVSGGAGTIRYALSGSFDRELGLTKLPDVDVALLRAARIPVIDAIQRPQENQRQNGTAKFETEFGGTTVSLTTLFARQMTRGTPLSAAIDRAAGFPPPIDAFGPGGILLPRGSGLLDAIPDFRKEMIGHVVRTTNAIDARRNFAGQISAQVTAGIDVSTRHDQSLIAKGDCYGGITSTCDNRGFYYTGQGGVTKQNINVRASMPRSLSRLLSITSSIGGNFDRTTGHELLRSAVGLPVGATTGNGAEEYSESEIRDDRATAGIYAGTQIGILDRVYIPLELRKDAGSALGSKIAPTFPRLSFSYIVSDDPQFRRIPLIGGMSTFRLRVAYGQAGRQPGVGATLRTYTTEAAIIDGVSTDVVGMIGLGNSRLKPERSREFEGGFDADLLRDRVTLTMSWYRKNTSDLLITEVAPPSVGIEDRTRQVNLGDVLNNGMETTIGVTVFQRRSIQWRSNILMSRQRNKLIRLNTSLPGLGIVGVPSGIQTLHVVGYPLNGQWARPIIGYADRNGDGRILASEVLLSDSAVFIGAPYPKFTSNMSQDIRLLGQIFVGLEFTYQNGVTQVRRDLPYDRADNDPTASLAEQAYGLHSALTNVQTVSTFRIEAFSFGWDVPRAITRTVVANRTIRLSLQGKNLGLWTNYRGKDPNVGANGESSADIGSLPKARVWGLTVGIN